MINVELKTIESRSRAASKIKFELPAGLKIDILKLMAADAEPRNKPQGESPHILPFTKNYKTHKSSESNPRLLTVVTPCQMRLGHEAGPQAHQVMSLIKLSSEEVHTW